MIENGGVKAFSDRYGLLPLYYCSTEESFGVSTSWVELQVAFRFSDLDHDALSCYFYGGLFPGDDTPFKDIRRIPPDSELRWDDGRLDISHRHTFPKGLGYLPEAEAVEEYVVRMNAVMHDYAQAAPAGVVVPLSGGQDSRHIFLSLVTQGHRVDAVTQRLPPPQSDDEVTVAAQLCAQAGVVHHVVQPGLRPVQLERQKNSLLGLETIHHAWLMPLRDWMNARGVTGFYDGYVGDVLSGSRYLTPARLAAWRDGDVGAFAQAFCSQRSYVEKLARRAYAREWTRERALSRIAREAGRFVDKPNPHNHFGLARARRVIAPALWPLLGDGREVMLPYLDARVLELLIDLPMWYSVNRRLHAQAIAQAFPDYAHIPYEAKHRSRRAEPARQRMYALKDSLLPVLQGGSGPVLDRGAALVRWSKSLLSGGANDTLGWVSTALYLLQLEALLAV